MMKLSDYVMGYIRDLGVRHVFLLPGGGCMHLVDSLGRTDGLDYVCNLNEQAVSIAVEAYGQYTNNLGVGLVTTGPGGTNAVTGVAAAWVESTPCMILSGQVKIPDLIGNSGLRQMGMQEVDIVSIVKTITKYAITIIEPDQIRYHLEKAVYLAQSGRPGPVWLDIPLDVQAAEIDEKNLMGFNNDEEEINVESSAKTTNTVMETIELLNSSQRPCILVGNGVRLAKAAEAFLELVDLLKIPVLTTWKAIDIFDENDDYYFGRPGSIGQRGANFIQQNADLLIVLGARLDFGQTCYNHKNFAPRAKKVVIDIDDKELTKLQTKIDIAAKLNASDFIDQFIKNNAGIKKVDRDEWSNYCHRMKDCYPVVQSDYYSEMDYVNPYVFVDILSEHLDGDSVVVPGSSGMCSEITMQSFKVKKGQRILNTQGFGAMGFGLPASIGVCLASGKKQTICINGDGGFQLNIQELETVARLNLPIKFFVFNNQGFGSITNTQRNYFNGFYVASEQSSGLTLPDICSLAHVYGIKSIRIRNHQELNDHLEEILMSDGPIICDVTIDPLFTARPRMSSMILEDGTMMSMPMEDLWPFLEKEEHNRNMLK